MLKNALNHIDNDDTASKKVKKSQELMSNRTEKKTEM